MSLENLAALLNSRNTVDRVRAIQRLAKMAGPETQPLLLKALKDRSNFVAATAAEALGQCADLSAAKEMIERFLYLSEDGPKRDPGCHVRAHLAFGLGRLEYLHADEALRIGIRTVQIEPVGGVLYDTGAHLRGNCALALAQLHAPDALTDITLLLFDHGTKSIGQGDTLSLRIEPRKAAAQALARLGIPEARTPLVVRLTFPEGEAPEVLQECMEALVTLQDPRAPELLLTYIHESDANLAAFAGLMLARTQFPNVVPVLKELAARLSGNPLRATLLALTTLRTEEAANALKELAQDPRKAVREAVAEILAEA